METIVNFSLILSGDEEVEEKGQMGRKSRTEFIFLHQVREGTFGGDVLRLQPGRILNKCFFHFLVLVLL